MDNQELINLIKDHFSFLIKEYNYEFVEAEIAEFDLYAKYISDNAGIYVRISRRSLVPNVQFTITEKREFSHRPGLSTLAKYMIDEQYRVDSYFLNEILELKASMNYKDLFRDFHSYDQVIKFAADLVKKYAIDFVKGNPGSYCDLEIPLKQRINDILEGRWM